MFGQGKGVGFDKRSIEMNADERVWALGFSCFNKFYGIRFDPQLFVKFSCECFAMGFAGFDFAAGKFPVTGKGFGCTALGAKKMSVSNDERGDDFDGFHISNR